jgi:hypothetical protein
LDDAGSLLYECQENALFAAVIFIKELWVSSCIKSII